MKELNTSTKVLIILGMFLMVFIIAMTAIFCVKGSVPDTLISSVLGTGGIEVFVLAGIKIVKTIKGGNEDNQD